MQTSMEVRLAALQCVCEFLRETRGIERDRDGKVQNDFREAFDLSYDLGKRLTYQTKEVVTVLRMRIKVGDKNFQTVEFCGLVSIHNIDVQTKVWSFLFFLGLKILKSLVFIGGFKDFFQKVGGWPCPNGPPMEFFWYNYAFRWPFTTSNNTILL